MLFKKRLTTALLSVLLLLGFGATSAMASTTQQSILTDPNVLYNPGGIIAQAKSLGFTMVKVPVVWNTAVPSPNSSKKPSGFNPTSQASYKAQFFTTLNSIVQIAKADGVQIGFQFVGPGPVWADGKGAVAHTLGKWKLNTTYFKDFVQVVGKAFPSVNWWSIWNEPNYGTQIAPELTNGGRTDEGAILYRGLLNAAYSGLKASGHIGGANKVLIGELAPRWQKGSALGGERPLQFLAALYGTTTSGKRLTGSAARADGTNMSAAAFRAKNPLLFKNSGLAIHPYAQGVAPNVPTYTCSSGACQNPKTKKSDPYYADFAEIGRLESSIDRDLRGQGSHAKPTIWNTEYGYGTTGAGQPACHGALADCTVSQATAAYYLNWAEYLSYKSSRIVSFDQYQLNDASSWVDGLYDKNGKAKTTVLDAYELPLYLPTTTLKSAGSVTVWGGLRPAAYTKPVGGVQVQFQPKGSSSWSTLATVTSLNSRGYFTTHVSVPSSGNVRLSYGPVTSRSQAVTVK